MTPQEIIAIIAPEFVNNPTLSGAIELATNRLGKILIPDDSIESALEDRNTLIAYLAAHILTIANRPGGATGDISSMQIGAASISYTNNKTNQKYVDNLVLTSYGREYLALKSKYTQCFYISGIDD